MKYPNNMNIKETFLNLTKRTYPHGTEEDLFHLLPNNIQTDEFGNKFLWIGDNSTTMFTCHLDTASSQVVDVRHKFEKNIITTDGTTILGADDKAGMTILLYMIEHNIPGLYYFFLGEERGCVGSRSLANKHKKEPLPNITKVISFDRRGNRSVITHQMGGRCCSEVFGTALSEELNKNESTLSYGTDPNGIYTDSSQFINIYQECTNVSVGYNYEHTHSEEQDILHLEKLCSAVIKVKWESLPISRKTNEVDEYDELDDYYYPSYRGRSNTTTTTKSTSNKSWTTEYYFVDTDFSTEKCSVSINKYTNTMDRIELSDERLDYECDLIQDLLETLEVEYKEMEWDGNTLTLDYEQGNVSKTTREEMTEYIKDLNFWKHLINIK
jgi:hypothetical protein